MRFQNKPRNVYAAAKETLNLSAAYKFIHPLNTFAGLFIVYALNFRSIHVFAFSTKKKKKKKKLIRTNTYLHTCVHMYIYIYICIHILFKFPINKSQQYFSSPAL